MHSESRDKTAGDSPQHEERVGRGPRKDEVKGSNQDRPRRALAGNSTVQPTTEPQALPSTNKVTSNRGRGRGRRGPGRPRVEQEGEAPLLVVEGQTTAQSPKPKQKGRRGGRRGGGAGPSRFDQLNESSGMNNGLKSTNSSYQSQPLTEEGGGGRGRGRQPRRARANGDQAAPDSPQLTVDLAEQLRQETLECIVCYENIRRKAPVWSCDVCYKVFHLLCITKWATASISAPTKDAAAGWRCPGCQNANAALPKRYRCFCGKVTFPEWNPYDTPHTCGGMCARKRVSPDGEGPGARPVCRHACPMRCHPGPCPPCGQYITQTCKCGRLRTRIRCSDALPDVDCGQACGRLLSCSKHPCTLDCHVAPCPPCDKQELQHCYCGKGRRTAPCASGELDIARLDTPAYYSCTALCNRPLSCGSHLCTEPCHSGPCPSCPRTIDKIRTCPCGSTRLIQLEARLGRPSRTTCTDPILTCGGTCGKPLACGGNHRCPAPCHEGPCPECNELVQQTCRCGMDRRQIVCQQLGKEGWDVFLCNRTCQQKRHCRRHKCGIRCCSLSRKPEANDPAGLHMCTLTCGRQLACTLHTCTEPCHTNPCPPCLQANFDELACECGRTVLFPPVPCNTPPPPCPYPCTRVHPCPHPPTHNCHNEPQCPPCPILVDRRCAGDHELRRFVPCHQQYVFCGKPCNRPLSCGHKCAAKCHKGPCPQDPDGRCHQECGKVLAGCGHGCVARCHLDTLCPLPCRCKIIILCRCGRRKAQVMCMSTARTPVQLQVAVDSQGGHSTIHDELIRGERFLDCDGECALKERNMRLAIALDVDPAKHPEPFQPVYSEELLDIARRQPKLVATVEAYFAHVIRDFKSGTTPQSAWGGTPSIRMLPVMTAPNRKFVHELGTHYALNTISLDREPQRSVKAIATVLSEVPSLLLSQAANESSASTSFGRLATSIQGTSVPGKAGWVALGKSTDRGVNKQAEEKNTKEVAKEADLDWEVTAEASSSTRKEDEEGNDLNADTVDDWTELLD